MDDLTASAPPSKAAATAADDYFWYTGHTALLISTIKWALLGALAGVCVGLGTKLFLWALGAATAWTTHLNLDYAPEYGRLSGLFPAAAGPAALRLAGANLCADRQRPRYGSSRHGGA